MIDVRKTNSGWIVETTSEVNGMLEQGGVSGRRVFYSRLTLVAMGIDYNNDPHAPYNEHTDNVDLLLSMRPDRVLSTGHKIQ